MLAITRNDVTKHGIMTRTHDTKEDYNTHIRTHSSVAAYLRPDTSEAQYTLAKKAIQTHNRNPAPAHTMTSRQHNNPQSTHTSALHLSTTNTKHR